MQEGNDYIALAGDLAKYSLDDLSAEMQKLDEMPAVPKEEEESPLDFEESDRMI